MPDSKIPSGFTATCVTTFCASPNATKHTWAEKSRPHIPVDIALVENEIKSVFAEKINLRQGEIFNVNLLPSNSIYLELQSQTTYSIGGQDHYSYREIGAEITPAGQCTVTHYREHQCQEDHKARIDRFNQYGFKFVVKVEPES